MSKIDIDMKDLKLLLKSSLVFTNPKLIDLMYILWGDRQKGLIIDESNPMVKDYEDEFEILKYSKGLLIENYVNGEWRAKSQIEEIFDNEKRKCERCNATIKKGYRLENIVNHNVLIVGSECITLFIDKEKRSIEINTIIRREIPNYDELKKRIKDFYSNKKYPFPSSIFGKGEYAYRSLQKTEEKLFRGDTSFVYLLQSLKNDIIPNSLEVIRIIEEYHAANKSEDFYCDEEIYKEIESDRVKVKLVESNNSYINHEISRKISSKKFYLRFKNKIEDRLRIRNIDISLETVSFDLAGIRVKVNRNSFLNIASDIVFYDNYDKLKYNKLIVKFDKDSLFRNFNSKLERNIYQNELEISLEANDYGYFIVKNNKYLEYSGDFEYGMTLNDAQSIDKLISIMHKNIAKKKNKRWVDFNELESIRREMEKKPSNS